MSRDNIICGLDIGTSNTRAVIAQIRFDQEKPQVLGVGQTLSFGLRRGIVVDIAETANSIKQAIEEAEKAANVSIESALVNIGGNHITCRFSKGVVAVSRADGEISEEDKDRAIKAAKTIQIPQNRELLHVIPRHFTVDEEKFIKDPVGMSGVRLEADTLLIEGSTPFIKNLTKSLHEAEIGIDNLVLSNLASAKAVLSKRQKELGVAVLNIGASTTSLAVFEEGEVIATHVIPIGSSHITSDIAIGLRTSIDNAEEVKVRYGVADPGAVERKEDIDLSKITDGETGIVSRRHVAEIIEARVEEIFKLTDLELAKIERSGKLPAGIVITGGGAKLNGMIGVARKIFKLPASIGAPREVASAIDKVDDPSLATAVGLVRWGERFGFIGGKDNSFFRGQLRSFGGGDVGDKVKRWLKAFMPWIFLKLSGSGLRLNITLPAIYRLNGRSGNMIF